MRWRTVVWTLLLVVGVVGALLFRGAKHSAAKQEIANTGEGAPKAVSSGKVPRQNPTILQSTVSASTAPMVFLSSNLTNQSRNPHEAESRFAYRVSNTSESIDRLQRSDKAILLENALIDSSRPLDLQIPESLRSHGDPGSYIVQSRGAITEAFRSQLKNSGAKIISYIPNNAYLIRASAGIAQGLSGNPNVQAVIPFEPQYKVKASLMKNVLMQKPVAALNAAVFTDAHAETIAALQKLGASIVSESPSPFGIQMILENVSDVAAIAQLPGIAEVEPHSKRILANDLSRVTTGVASNTLILSNYMGLTGSNVLVAVNDSWVCTNGDSILNPDLTNLLWLCPVGIADIVGHATHVAGIIGSSGLNSPTNAMGSVPFANFRGMAPSANLFALPLDDTSDFDLQQAAARTNALISNNSWGYNDPNYNLAAASYDAAVRDALPGVTGSQPVLFVFAAGNDGNGQDDGLSGDPDSVLSPAIAKNVITVGSIEQPRNITNDVTRCSDCDTNIPCSTNKPWLGFTDSSNEVARFSARGNVGIGIEGESGRVKPDVVAPGTFVVSTRSMLWDTNAYYNPTNHHFNTFSGAQLDTNSLFFDNLFIPCDAVQFNIFASAVRPVIDLPIYVRQDDFPTTADLLGTNQVFLPPDKPLDPTGVFWFYAIGNPTNVAVEFDLTTELVTTNDLGSYFDILRTNLNDQLFSTNGDLFYRYESGTSMSAADVSGLLALIQDFFTNQWNFTPSPALLKALLINGARTVNNIYDFRVDGPINYQGWGLVNLTNSLPFGITNIFAQPTPMLFVDQDPTNALATGDSRTVTVAVDPAAQNQPLRVTLVWTDPPGNPAAGIKLVNNLDLVVTNLDNTNIYFGNDIGAGSTFNSTWDTNTVPKLDVVNNVENVYLAPPLGSNYSITVVGRAVNVNAVTAHTNGVVQDYALVISSGDGAITNALTLTNAPIVSTNSINLTTITNQFGTPSQPGDVVGGLLLGEHVGASSPLVGTNELPLSTVNQTDWGTNGQITIGQTNQWHFYILTNEGGSDFTNAAFATFLAPNLSPTRMGVTNQNSPDEATRPEADIDLYVSTNPALTNLDPVVVAAADKSLTRSGTEVIVYTNAVSSQVYYIGVKSEDQQAAEYDFAGLFSDLPFSTTSNGVVVIRGVPPRARIPDGTPRNPGIGMVLGISAQPVAVRRVVVTNTMTHENFGDLFGHLTHERKDVGLNNHTFGNTSLQQQTFVYEDNDENDVPGSQHTDGPNSLKDFIGQQGSGVWVLREADNAPIHTGRVDQVYIRLEPQTTSNGDTNSIDLNVQPNSFAYDFIDVPKEATNLTIRAENITTTGAQLPVQLYVRYGDLPTTTAYDYVKTIPPIPGGDILSIGLSDLPPLRPGRYYFGIYNPNGTMQTVRVSWTIGLDLVGIEPDKFTSTNAPVIFDDATTTDSSIFITNHQKIVEVEVGAVIDHIRVSDLALTLVSPTGKRILLYENRGGPLSTNLGAGSVVTNFFQNVPSSGGPNADTNVIGPVPTSGTLIVDYEFFTQPDSLDVYYDGVNIFTTGGFISGSNTFTIPYGPGVSTNITIVVNQNGNTNSTTVWDYTPRVVTPDYAYFVFTEDTNLTQTPVKFAIPPFASTNFANTISLGDFDSVAAGDYSNGTVEGWTILSNQVSVVTDPTNALSPSNFLALANGSIFRTLTTTPGTRYAVTLNYRGPGIASWWPGDASGQELINGNTAVLSNGLTFTTGIVSNAFLFDGSDDYARVAWNPTLDVGKSVGMTVDCWIKPASIITQRPLVEWMPPGADTNLSDTRIIAGPIRNPGNDNFYYVLYSSSSSWSNSEVAAKALKGDLVTINDAAENAWITANILPIVPGMNPYIGLYNLNFPGGSWAWISGQPVTYTNWNTALGEPNFSWEHYANMFPANDPHPGTWNNTIENDTHYSIVEVDALGNEGVHFWISTGGPGTLYANLMDTNDVSHTIQSASGIVNTNTFQHVAVTYDQFSGTAKLYYNGRVVANSNLGRFVPKTTRDVLLGRRYPNNTEYFYKGAMDEVGIYNRALSGSEIQAIFTNGAAGKFDAASAPPQNLAKARVTLSGIIPDVLYGDNTNWQTRTYTFRPNQSSTDLQIDGLEPGMLLDSLFFSEAGGDTFVLPEQTLKDLVGTDPYGLWTLEVRDARTGATNAAQLVSWQLRFIFQNDTPAPVKLQHGIPATNTVPPCQLAYFTVDVPPWASYATNTLLFADAPVNVWFNQTTPPVGTNPPDFGLITNLTSGSYTLATNGFPTLVPGQRYYIAVENPCANATNVSFAFEVDYNITPLTNGIPLTNEVLTAAVPERYFSYVVTNTNSVAVRFELFNVNGNVDLVARKGAPLPDLFNFDFGSFNGGANNETILISTNSVTLTPGIWYLGVFNRAGTDVTYTIQATEIGAPTIIPLTNGVPFNFTAAPGPASTNFFSFQISDSNPAVLFELYNLTGNGDLTVERSNLPYSAPFTAQGINLGTTPEQIVIRTNTSPLFLTDLNGTWFLGVPNNETTNITYTIRAVVSTNGMLISGQPITVSISRPGGNIQLTWPTIDGENYEVQTNTDLTTTNWGPLTNLTASGTSATIVDPIPVSGVPVQFYRVVQIP